MATLMDEKEFKDAMRPIVRDTINEGMRMGAYTIAGGTLALIEAGADLDTIKRNLEVIIRDNGASVEPGWKSKADANAKLLKAAYESDHRE